MLYSNDMKIYFCMLKCVFCCCLLLVCQKSVAQLPDAPSYCELAFTVNHLDTCTNGNAVEITILSDERCGLFILEYGYGQVDILEAGMCYHNYRAALKG